MYPVIRSFKSGIKTEDFFVLFFYRKIERGKVMGDAGENA